jgi:collagenase-like protein with putative collagen-binding domain
MQVRRARGGILAALLGLAVLPSALPLGLPVGRQAVDVVVGIPRAAGTLLVVRHAGTAPVTVDTTVLTGPAVRGWWVDGTTGQNVDVGALTRGPAVTLHPPDTGDGAAHDWTLVIVDMTRGLVPPA